MTRHLVRRIASRLRLPFRHRPRRFVFNYEGVLGTSLELQVVAADEQAARLAESEVLAEVDRLEPILSGWSDASELARWQRTHHVAAEVSPELADVLHLSAVWRDWTGRAFDPAAQSVIDRLRGAGEAAGSAPRGDDPADPSAEHPDDPLWIVDRAGGTARRLTQGAISLDAIAKGYIVSRAAARATLVPGVTDVLLNIGGDLQHYGSTPSDVGIADPRAPAENARPIAVVRVRNAALATSGGYRRGFIASGRRVSHLVDSRSGQPVEHTISASVIAPDCATADALSTAFSVLTPAESVAFADALPDVGVFIVAADGTTTANAAWKARVVAASHAFPHSR